MIESPAFAKRSRRKSSYRRRFCFEQLEERAVFSSVPFTVAVLPDTQFYTQSFPQTFDAQTQWILDNRVSRNIAFVTHVGDIVQSAETGTNRNLLQWQRADSSMDRLDGNLSSQLDGVLPYSVALGNHDYGNISDKTSGSARYQEFFGPQRYENRSWYTEDSGMRGGHAQIFESGGYRFLHITVQFEALDSDLSWAQSVIDRYPGLPTILSTHSYLNPTSEARQATIQGDSGGVPNQGNTGEQVFQKLVYNNPSIFLVLNGHFSGEFTQISKNRAGQDVIESVTDYQSRQNGGDGWLRLLEFRPQDNRIDFTTYSPTRNEFETDANSQFSIPFNFIERIGAPFQTGQSATTFQNGKVIENTIYNGAVDTQIRQIAPTTSYGSSVDEVLVDAPDPGASNTSHALLKFTGLFGSGAAQIPTGAQILSAKLVLDSINPGAGAKVHRLLSAWDGTTTWNSWSGGIQANNVDASSVLSAQLGSAALAPLVPVDSNLSIDVTNDVRLWANGTPNHGWAFLPWDNGTNGWSFSPSEVTSIGDRPSLEIEWLPPTGANVPTSIVVDASTISYDENSSASLLFPNATVSDFDSANFDGGSLQVDITTNAAFEDRLFVRNEGNAIGQIGVNASTVSYGGVPIGQMSEGIGAKPLTVSLNGNATIAAVQALLRNLAYRNTSDNPSISIRKLRMFVFDGDGGVSNPLVNSISITATNDAPAITSSSSAVSYLAGGPSTRLDPFATIIDPDSSNFNGGALTFSIAANGQPFDSLNVRNEGNAAGQIGVSINSVSYGGILIGTLSGGTNGTQLRVDLTTNSNAVNVQALIRSIVFQTTDQRIVPPPRTITLIATDGDGGTSEVTSWQLHQSLVRRYRYQESVDSGLGIYSGSADIQLRQSDPGTAYPIGSTPSDGMLVDYDAALANSQTLLRFDNVFGAGNAKVPLGAKIVSARLVLDTNNPGDGASFHRMLTSWNALTETWNSFGNSSVPRNATGGVQANNSEARTEYQAQVGTAFGTGDADEGKTVVGVTADVQAWANGQSNFGWLLQGWPGFTNGFAFSSSEAPNVLDRPILEIDWIPSSTQSVSFQQGTNGYLGSIDTELEENAPTRNNASSSVLFVDDNSPDPLNPSQRLADQSQVLLRFDQLNGNLANQIPSGSLIHSAVVTLASTASDSPGLGGRFYRMNQNWNSLSTWNSLVDGVQANGTEAVINVSTQVGGTTNVPDVEGGWNSWDVTADVQAWTNNPSSNYGWAILPILGGTDGWGIQSSESAIVQERPQLQVAYTPLGVSVTPTSSLTTTELGGTASFSIVLDTPPTANVTFGLASSNLREGILSATSVTFTTADWYIPKTITVTGIDDFIADGNTNYSIVISSAISLDSNYNGFNPNDVSVSNTGNGQIYSAAVVNRQLFYNRSTSSIFGDGTGNPVAAIDSTKSALLPGQTASFANYSNYIRGLNGLIVDVAGLITATPADFQFAVWNGISASGFTSLGSLPTVTVLTGQGLSGSTRIKVEFADNVVRNTWLRVTLLSNPNTQLPSNDVFYFGNMIGDFNVGNEPSGSSSTVIVHTDAADSTAIRRNMSSDGNSVGISNLYDINKDGRVNALDVALVRQNHAASKLRTFTAPTSLRLSTSVMSITPSSREDIAGGFNRGKRDWIDCVEILFADLGKRS